MLGRRWGFTADYTEHAEGGVVGVCSGMYASRVGEWSHPTLLRLAIPLRRLASLLLSASALNSYRIVTD